MNGVVCNSNDPRIHFLLDYHEDRTNDTYIYRRYNTAKLVILVCWRNFVLLWYITKGGFVSWNFLYGLAIALARCMPWFLKTLRKSTKLPNIHENYECLSLWQFRFISKWVQDCFPSEILPIAWNRNLYAKSKPLN